MNKLTISKFGWSLLLIAIIGDFLVPYVLANFYKGYSHTATVMSALGNSSSPVKIPYNSWLVCLGVLLLLSLPMLYKTYFSVSKLLTVVLLIILAMFGIGAGILSGIFSVNETKEVQTVASQIHGISASIGFMLLILLPLVLSILSFKSFEKMVGIFSILCFFLAFISFVCFIMSDKETFQKTVFAKEGLWQRLTLFFSYLPLGIISISNIFQW